MRGKPTVGQKVVCLQPDGDWLRLRQVYTIQEVWDDGLGGYLIGVDVMRGQLWGTFRFEEHK